MQLDELKILWKADSEPDPFDRDTLSQMLRHRSKSAVAKIRQNVWMEIIFLILMAAGTLSWFVLRELPVHWTEWCFFAVLFPANGLLYWYKIRVFIQRDEISRSLVHSLDTYIHKLDAYLSLYKMIIPFMVPVLSTAGIFYGFTIARLEGGKGLADLPWEIYPILAAVTIGYVFLAMRFVKWYIKKLYGDHLEELKQVREELTETVSQEN